MNYSEIKIDENYILYYKLGYGCVYKKENSEYIKLDCFELELFEKFKNCNYFFNSDTKFSIDEYRKEINIYKRKDKIKKLKNKLIIWEKNNYMNNYY